MTFSVISNDADSLLHVTQSLNTVLPSCIWYYSIKQISLINQANEFETAQVVHVSRLRRLIYGGQVRVSMI